MRTLSLVSDASKPCGVEGFARGLAGHLASRDGVTAHAVFGLTGKPGEQALLARAGDAYDALIVNLPVVAWKKSLAGPLVAMVRARARGRETILILHEWADLDWKRRVSYWPALRFASRILFSSPHVRAQFEADRASRFATRRRGLVPIPPNMSRPDTLPATAWSQRIAALRAGGTLVIGQFGAIYPKKQTTAVLDIAAAVAARGRDVHAVFIGDFVDATSGDPRADFARRLTELGLADKVSVTGYIGPSAEVFAAIEACDAMVYRLPEGLTSRRGSVLAGLQTSTPVLVNAPAHDREFDHHPTFRRAIDDKALVLLAHDADPAAYADAVLTLPTRTVQPVIDFERAWLEVVEAVDPSPVAAARHEPTPPARIVRQVTGG